MDIKNNTNVLNEIINKSSETSQKLNHGITLIKNEFKIVSSQLEGEQFEIFKEKSYQVCESINDTIELLLKLNAFIEKLMIDIEEYDNTRME